MEKDIHFLKTPGLWPCYPICPVKKPKAGDFPLCGCVLDFNWMEESGTVKGLTSVVMLDMRKQFTSESLRNAVKYKYESAEAMVADGWIVD